MIIQQRPEPLEILLFRALFERLVLLENHIIFSEKGYEGELRSDKWLEDLNDSWLVLHGLLLEYNGSKFQIDTLIIAHEKIYLLDVKNYEGDYYLEDDKWYPQPQEPTAPDNKMRNAASKITPRAWLQLSD